VALTGLADLTGLVAAGGVVVLSGAGLSTESGIPDYRGPSGAALRRHAPMTYQAFTRDAEARRRYWARSHVGWRHIAVARPNEGHAAVAAWEEVGLLRGVITQNVDGLHQGAGSRHVVDLHGRLDRVVCLDCGALTGRAALDARLTALNEEWRAQVLAVNPDGDVDLDIGDAETFTVADCEQCGGLLKPDVVYFGESVPRERVSRAQAMVDAASALVVLGSSLHVYSGRRFVVQAAEHGIPVAIVNQGPTRADALAAIRIDAPLGPTLSALTQSIPCGVTRPT
jgi:NAD-dependent SIR2 family protein deacetylase